MFHLNAIATKAGTASSVQTVSEIDKEQILIPQIKRIYSLQPFVVKIVIPHVDTVKLQMNADVVLVGRALHARSVKFSRDANTDRVQNLW